MRYQHLRYLIVIVVGGITALLHGILIHPEQDGGKHSRHHTKPGSKAAIIYRSQHRDQDQHPQRQQHNPEFDVPGFPPPEETAVQRQPQQRKHCPGRSSQLPRTQHTTSHYEQVENQCHPVIKADDIAQPRPQRRPAFQREIAAPPSGLRVAAGPIVEAVPGCQVTLDRHHAIGYPHTQSNHHDIKQYIAQASPFQSDIDDHRQREQDIGLVKHDRSRRRQSERYDQPATIVFLDQRQQPQGQRGKHGRQRVHFDLSGIDPVAETYPHQRHRAQRCPYMSTERHGKAPQKHHTERSGCRIEQLDRLVHIAVITQPAGHIRRDPSRWTVEQMMRVIQSADRFGLDIHDVGEGIVGMHSHPCRPIQRCEPDQEQQGQHSVPSFDQYTLFSMAIFSASLPEQPSPV